MPRTFLICLCLLSGCLKKESPQSKKLIIGLAGCSEPEANADIEESLTGIEKAFSGKVDSVYAKASGSECGYELVNGNSIKKIEGASTDVDLMLDANEFFGFSRKN